MLGGWGDLFQLFRIDFDEGVRGLFVALHDFVALDHALAMRAVELLTNARPANLVNLMEADMFAPRRGVQADRYRDEPEGKITLPDSGSHSAALLFESPVEATRILT